ncbi:unnamed protein product, partial [Allacma fusca]
MKPGFRSNISKKINMNSRIS